MNYYKAVTTAGHMGAGNEGELVFYLKAPTIISAMSQAKRFPAVKHSRMPSVCMVTKEEYEANITTSAYTRCGYNK